MQTVDYRILTSQADALTDAVDDGIANLANISALIYSSLDRLNWAGFYILRNGRLVLGPFQGKPACVYIDIGRGVCGTAAAQNATKLVPDVHKFPGHIACDGASNSEIVIPLHLSGQLFGVLDIDSPVVERFDESDRAGLEGIAELIERKLENWSF